MGKPNQSFIKLKTGPRLAEQLLDDLFAKPRREVIKWSRLTNQTAQVRLAYPGQHLASAITGVRGVATAARGFDLEDGSEVKSCSRADQLGSCKQCLAPVLPYEESCPQCGGSDLKRKTDSHWILSIKSKTELEQYLQAPRIVLILFDRMDAKVGAIRVRAWEVWPGEERHEYFAWFVTNYFAENYSLKISRGLTPAPLNLHPLKYDFYMMNPVLIFEAVIAKADSQEANVEVQFMADPAGDRAGLTPEPMPANTMSLGDRRALVSSLSDEDIHASSDASMTPEQAATIRARRGGETVLAKSLRILDEHQRLKLARKVKRIKLTASTYRRRLRT